MPLGANINNKVSPVPFNTQQTSEILIDSELYNQIKLFESSTDGTEIEVLLNGKCVTLNVRLNV